MQTQSPPDEGVFYGPLCYPVVRRPVERQIFLGTRAFFLYVALLIWLPGAVRARVRDEPTESRNALYIEMLGNAGLYSVNYDRVVTVIADKHRLGFRIGFSLVPVDTQGVQLPLTFPLTVNYMYGIQRRFEVGLGITPNVSFDQNWSARVAITPAVTVGFRLQRTDNDFLFRIGAAPLFFDGFFPWIGISLGRAF